MTREDYSAGVDWVLSYISGSKFTLGWMLEVCNQAEVVKDSLIKFSDSNCGLADSLLMICMRLMVKLRQI